MKKITITFLLLGCISYAQKQYEPTTEEIKKAVALRETYKKSDIAILESSEIVKFNVSKDEKNVEVTSKVNEKLMNINHRADIHKYEFYDGQSEINVFKFKYKTNKDVFFPIRDEFYKSDDLFYNDARVKYAIVDFPLQGYTYNFEQEKKTKDIKYFTSIYFVDEYPVIEKEIVIEVPKWLELEIKEMNFSGHAITKTSSTLGEITTYKYKIKNLEPNSTESFTSGPSYLYPHILFVAKSFTYKTKKNTLFSTTLDLYKWYKSLVNDMKDDSKIFESKVKELIANAKTDEEKIKKIYYWVQDNIRYIAFENGIAGFKPDESQNVFNKRYGDCKGMANLTKQMLKIAGYDARLCWIGTKHIAYNYSIPSLSVDNHMICSLQLNGKRYFLDGTEKYNPFGEYAERIQGKEVLIEDGEKYILEKIPSHKSIDNKEKTIINYSVNKENLVGTITKEFIGESKSSFLYSYNVTKNDKKEDALKYYLSNNDKNFIVSDIVTSDLNNRDQKLNLQYKANILNKVSTFDNEMYIDLDYDKEYSSLDFKERKKDFEFDFKKYDDIEINFQIPENYKVSKLPQNINITTDDYTISLTYEVVGNTIKYKKIFNFKNGVIKSAKFNDWKNHFESINKNYSEQIVLTK